MKNIHVLRERTGRFKQGCKILFIANIIDKNLKAGPIFGSAFKFLHKRQYRNSNF